MRKKNSPQSIKDSLFVGLSGKEKSGNLNELGDMRSWAKEQFFGWSRWGSNPIVMKMGN